MEFGLYRIKVVRPFQEELFALDVPAPELVRAAIRWQDEMRDRKGGWHIGNIEEISDRALFFALGRESQSKIPVRSPDTGDFGEQEVESAPFTHVFLDVELELCAIENRTILAVNTDAMARQLARLLNEWPESANSDLRFAVVPIKYPDAFLEALEGAYAITSFTVFFTRPNPSDVEEEFMRPMERLAQKSDALYGSTTVRGESLDVETLKELTRSAAASGDDAKARVRLARGKRPVQRSLKGANARLTQEALETPGEKTGFLERLRETYHQIRGTLEG